MKRHSARRKSQARAANTNADKTNIGRVFIVEIERIVPGGYGLAHAEGITLLVALAAPGDTLKVEVESTRGRACFARVLDVVKPSAARVNAPCPYFGDPHRCGGCDFQQLSYEAQLAAKLDIICDALRRTARLTTLPQLKITPAPHPWNYRSRAEWQHDAARQRLGYFRRGTHEVVDVESCPVLVPSLEMELEELRKNMRKHLLPDDVSEYRAMIGDAAHVALAPPLTHLQENPQANLPDGDLQRTIRGETYRYNAECFFQINHELLPDLIAEALRCVEGATEVAATNAADVAPFRRGFALDLYCGVGLFTLPLARHFDRVVGIEAHRVSSSYARENLRAAALANTTIETMPVKDWLLAHENKLPSIDFVILDPPRAGADAETIASLIRLRPQRIAYVSCDPVTLARDIGALIVDGYKLEALRLFDLFPQTHHVETIAHLALA